MQAPDLATAKQPVLSGSRNIDCCGKILIGGATSCSAQNSLLTCGQGSFISFSLKPLETKFWATLISFKAPAQPEGNEVRPIRARQVVFGVLLWLGLSAANQGAHAQSASSGFQQLPPIVVHTAPSGKPGRARTAARPVRRPPAVPAPTRVVYPTTPVSNTGIEIEKVPASVNIVDVEQIDRAHSANITDALQQYVPSIVVNEVAGNPFQPNVQFRGFVASPVTGTPQGLAVYQNGVRVNEAFGDTVNWDLIPTAAIQSIAVVTNNPAFGLNSLGGAINLQMKDGFKYQGAEINSMGGSFGRIQSSAQWGKQYDHFAVYGALEGLHDNGFRNFSASNVRRFYGDIGYKEGDSEFHLNMGVADNNFGATTTAPIETPAAAPVVAPVAAAAQTISTITSPDFVAKFSNRGAELVSFQLTDYKAKDGKTTVELVKSRDSREPASDETKKISQYCYEHGLITITAGSYGNVLRLLVPLVITEQQMDEGLDVLEAALASVSEKQPSFAEALTKSAK